MADKAKIAIEKGIPVPARSKNEAAKYPWREMEIGDSFLVPRENDEPMTLTRDRANKVTQYAKRTGASYCSRTVEGGIRIWRIA